jgi:NagD protein
VGLVEAFRIRLVHRSHVSFRSERIFAAYNFDGAMHSSEVGTCNDLTEPLEPDKNHITLDIPFEAPQPSSMIKGVLSDMDGVIYRGKAIISGASEFVQQLLKLNVPFLFLTNNSEQTPLDLLRKLEGFGLHGLKEENFMTSAMATALFLANQKPRGSAYVIGGAGLTNELYKVGFSITETKPDYVVVGKTVHFNFDMLRKASRLIREGAKFIGTNPDVLDPVESGWDPASGTILAAVETACGKKPYIVGKPNALMMTIARKRLDVRSSETAMIGDRMDTDIVGGMEAGMKTCLVLSGVTDRATLDQYPYKPDCIFDHVGQIDIAGL